MPKGRAIARTWTKKLTEESALGVPDELWDDLSAEFPFTVDACATAANAKLPRFWTKADDGLKQSWEGEVVWCHPLFDRDIILWIQKAVRAKNCTTVFLLPASTDTRWFSLIWDHYMHKARPGVEIRFLNKRLKYKPAQKCAAFASVVIIVKN